MREALEVMYSKIVLKPLTTILKRLKSSKEESAVAKSNNTTIGSAQSENANNNDSLDLENEDFIQVTYEKSS